MIVLSVTEGVLSISESREFPHVAREPPGFLIPNVPAHSRVGPVESDGFPMGAPGTLRVPWETSLPKLENQGGYVVVSAIESELAALPPELLARPGSIFYSGRAAFSIPSRLYVLGLNPGGSPVLEPTPIRKDLAWWTEGPEHFSRYIDERWDAGRAPAGTSGMQPRVRHMFTCLGLDPRQVPASNVAFVRSPGEADLAAEKSALIAQCWPVHLAVIETLGVDTVLCFGKTAGLWVREALGAHSLIDDFVELNNRRWTSTVDSAADGRVVVTTTHPSRVDWSNPAADPTPLVRRALERIGGWPRAGLTLTRGSPAGPCSDAVHPDA